MNLNKQQLCDDWGWYVDTDENLFINNGVSMSHKKIKYYTLEKLEEDEYDYYEKNNRDIEDLELDSVYEKIEKRDIVKINIYKIGSTTLITALLTYAIFFLI